MQDGSGVLIRRGGSFGTWAAPETTSYQAEAHLQEILAASPGWLPAVSPEARTVQELSTSAGFADICAVDIDGSLTVVECKLASSSEKRRMVIGQLIDYAAAVWRDGEQAFFDAWRRAQGVDLAEWLSIDAFDDLRANLAAGRFGLCLAVDAIDPDIKRLIEYLNLITRAEVSVTAIQLSYTRDGDVEVLIPTSFGGEIADAKVDPVRRTDRWTRESFLDALQDQLDRETAGWLLNQTERTPLHGKREYFWYGARPGGGLFLHLFGYRYPPVQLWVNKAGELMLYGNWNQFPSVKGHGGFDELAALLGQPDRSMQAGVRAATLDREKLWNTIRNTALAINSDEGSMAQSSRPEDGI